MTCTETANRSFFAVVNVSYVGGYSTDPLSIPHLRYDFTVHEGRQQARRRWMAELDENTHHSSASVMRQSHILEVSVPNRMLTVGGRPDRWIEDRIRPLLMANGFDIDEFLRAITRSDDSLRCVLLRQLQEAVDRVVADESGGRDGLMVSAVQLAGACSRFSAHCQGSILSCEALYKAVGWAAMGKGTDSPSFAREVDEARREIAGLRDHAAGVAIDAA